jgi:hypothetical protein
MKKTYEDNIGKTGFGIQNGNMLTYYQWFIDDSFISQINCLPKQDILKLKNFSPMGKKDE